MDGLLVFLRVLMLLLSVGTVAALLFLWVYASPVGAGIGISVIGTALILALVGFFLWLSFGSWW